MKLRSGDFEAKSQYSSDKLTRFYNFIERNEKPNNYMEWATFNFGYNEMYSRIRYNIGETCLDKNRCWSFKSNIYSKMKLELYRLEDMVNTKGHIPVMDGKIQCLKDCIDKYENMS